MAHSLRVEKITPECANKCSTGLLSIAMRRLGSPRFMLHDLRKLVATTGEKLGLSSAVLRRILNHTAPKSDVLHRHYIGLSVTDVAGAMVQIQEALAGMMTA